MKRNLIFLFTILALVAAFLTYEMSSLAKRYNQSYFNLDGINKPGRLMPETELNSTDYFINREESIGFTNGFLNQNINSLLSRRVSRYDDMIKEFSDSIRWDWRLLASLICQESEFKPNAVSGSGAYGLMQIMPVTAKNFGIDIRSSPENNMKAGILYINWLYSIFDSRIADEHERLSFVLAAYNAGPGHVLDAMSLAKKNGMDPEKWDGSVALWLLKKSERQYYKDSVVKNGYFRGAESVKFVSEVLNRFEHYKNTIPIEKNRPF